MMRGTLVLVLLAAMALVAWAPAWSALLIAGNTDGNIRDVDTSIPGDSVRYAVALGVTGLAVDDTNGILYGSGGGGAWNTMSIFDLTTGAELIDPGSRFVPPGYTELYGLEFLYDETGTGRLFSIGYQDGKNHLIEYDLGASGEPVSVKSVVPIVDTSGEEPVNMAHAAGLAFNTATGNFESNQSDNLYWEFDFTGEGTALCGLGFSGVNGLGLGEDGTIYSLSAGHEASVATLSIGDPGNQIVIADNTQVLNGWAMTGATTPRMESEVGPGDVDGNGVVDGLDLTAVLTAWETVPGDPLWNAAADLDDNDVVNGLDLTEVISNWTVASAAAPEAAASDTDAKPGRGNGRGKGNVRK